MVAAERRGRLVLRTASRTNASARPGLGNGDAHVSDSNGPSIEPEKYGGKKCDPDRGYPVHDFGRRRVTVSNNSLRASVTIDDYQAIRNETELLAAPLSPEDQQVQSMADVSPTKWHRAHITWFFETFILLEHLPGYVAYNEMFQFLFNSYYVSAGERHGRAERGLISRPSCDEVAAYRRHVDAAMAELIANVAHTSEAVHDLVILGLHHEQQHQELLLMDIKHVLSVNPTRPSYHDPAQSELHAGTSQVGELSWHRFDGGLVEIGYEGNEFHFDNEAPRHTRYVQPFELADRLVTNGDWLEFMADDGYHEPRHWLSAGWATIADNGWQAPLYWEPTARGWYTHTLHGFVAVAPDEPVCHVSYFEADAYARWAAARLPTEAEWEIAGTEAAVEGNFASAGRFHPRPLDQHNTDGVGISQLFGDVWEWTSSSYDAYPGFRPAAGAVGEYNGKFMANQYVLRGGCCATPAGHARATYRNFFPTNCRWMFSGVRLARDIAN